VTLAGSQVILNSDSSYVVNGINKWRHGWKKYDFAGVKNAELWKEIDELVTARRVEAVWVRGHDGNIHNEECDRMASAAYREAS
jgi:ribonuclease HI